MPTNSEIAKDDRNREQSEHATVTSRDIPGRGAAREAGRRAETRNRRQRSRLDEIMGQVRRNTR